MDNFGLVCFPRTDKRSSSFEEIEIKDKEIENNGNNALYRCSHWFSIASLQCGKLYSQSGRPLNHLISERNAWLIDNFLF